MTGPRKATAALGVFTALVLGCGDSSTRKVEMVEPAGAAYADETLTLRAVITGEVPATMTFRVDGAPLANVTPPYEYQWNARAVPEGDHMVDVQGRYSDDTTVTSAPRKITVDHQPLVVASRSPAPDVGTALPHVEASLTVSRDFIAPPGNPLSAVLRVDGTAQPATVEMSGRRFVARLQDPVAPGATVTVLWRGTLVDRVGHRLDLSAESWTFHVPPGFQRIDLFDDYSSSLAGGSKLAVTDLSSIRIYDGDVMERIVGPVAVGLAVRATRSGAVYAAASDPGDTISVRRFDAALTTLDPWTEVLSRPKDSDSVWFPDLAVDADGGVAVAWQRHAADAGFEYDVAQWSGGAWEKLTPREGNFGSIDLLAGHVVSFGADGLGSWSSGAWTPLALPARTYIFRRDPTGQLASVGFTDEGVVVQRLDVAGWVPVGPELVRGFGRLQADLAFDAAGRPVVALYVPNTCEVWRLETWGWNAVGELTPTGAGLPGELRLTTLVDGRAAATVTTSESRSDFHTAVFLERQ